MVAREPADTPTEQFAPYFTDPGLGARLRAAQTADGEDDVGLRLLDVTADPAYRDGEEDEAAGDAGDPSRAGWASPARRRATVIACLVVLAVALGVLTGYTVVRSAGGWDTIWVSAGEEGSPASPSPGASLGPARQAQPVPSASPSPSLSSASPSAPATRATPRPSEPGEGATTSPAPTRPQPSEADPSPSPTTTTPTGPEPSPSGSQPHEG